MIDDALDYRNYKRRYAGFLLRLAWTVEIIAVSIGLTISIVVSISASAAFAREGSGGFFAGAASVLVAGLPFVLVAVVELCKIPMAFACMNARHIFWTPLLMFFTMFLCIVTFETMLNGFERNFSNLNYAISLRQNDIENVNAEIELLERRRERIRTITEESLEAEIAAEQAAIDEEYRANLARVNRSSQNTLQGISYDFKEELDDEILVLMERRDKYYDDWNAEREQIEDRFSALLIGSISGSSDERERLIAELEELKAEMEERVAAANFLTRAGVEQRYRNLIAAKNEQLREITSGYLGSDALTKQTDVEEQLRQQLGFTNQKYERRLADVNELIEARQQEIEERTASNVRLKNQTASSAAQSRQRYARSKREQEEQLAALRAEKQEELDNVTVLVNEIEDKIFLLRNDQRNIQADINHLINANQVYRMAMYAYGKESPSEVTRRSVGIVALVWFGSLALICAATGVMLALASFYLKGQLEKQALAEAAASNENRNESHDEAEENLSATATTTAAATTATAAAAATATDVIATPDSTDATTDDPALTAFDDTATDNAAVPDDSTIADPGPDDEAFATTDSSINDDDAALTDPTASPTDEFNEFDDLDIADANTPDEDTTINPDDPPYTDPSDKPTSST